jgi:D-inositol-3-phosphate glycosyltransferase
MYQTSLTKGQELVAQRMVKEFRLQNYDAFLITSPYHDGEAVISDEELGMHAGYLYTFDENLGIPVIRVGSVPTSWPPRRASLVDFIDTLAKIVDNFKLNVLITHSTLWNGPEEILKFVEWRRNLSRDGVPKLTPLFCHMSHFQEASPDRYGIVERSFREAWNQTSLSLIVREADLVLVVSPHETEQMKERGATEEKCFLFPGGIEELTGLVGDPAELTGRLGIPPGTKLVTSFGTVEERKNTLNVVEAARRLADRKDVHFVIAGTEEGPYGKRVREEAAKLSNVSVMGPISDVDKSALIRATCINLILSRSEALGITQLEFMSNGVPVVSSGAGGQQWVVKDGENGIVLGGPDDTAGAAEAIVKLVDDEPLRQRLGRNARHSVAQFSMTRVTHALAKRLEGLAASRSDDERLRLSMTNDEQALEAMVNGRLKVIVTNRRLLVKDDHDGGETMPIPLEDISRITRQKRFSWDILAAGLGGAVLLAVALMAPPVRSYLSGVVPFGGGAWLLALIPIIPIAAVTPFFVRKIRDGYSIRSSSGSIFLPRQFLRPLKLVDRLTQLDLFDEEVPPAPNRHAETHRSRRPATQELQPK